MSIVAGQPTPVPELSDAELERRLHASQDAIRIHMDDVDAIDDEFLRRRSIENGYAVGSYGRVVIEGRSVPVMVRRILSRPNSAETEEMLGLIAGSLKAASSRTPNHYRRRQIALLMAHSDTVLLEVSPYHDGRMHPIAYVLPATSFQKGTVQQDVIHQDRPIPIPVSDNRPRDASNIGMTAIHRDPSTQTIDVASSSVHH